jgi:hypothetical protein
MHLATHPPTRPPTSNLPPTHRARYSSSVAGNSPSVSRSCGLVLVACTTQEQRWGQQRFVGREFAVVEGLTDTADPYQFVMCPASSPPPLPPAPRPTIPQTQQHIRSCSGHPFLHTSLTPQPSNPFLAPGGVPGHVCSGRPQRGQGVHTSTPRAAGGRPAGAAA